MTQEEIVKKRQELVHTMFSSTGEDFVRLVLENCRGGVSALSPEMRERMHAQEFEWNGFTWYKLRTGEPKGKTRKILYLHGGGWVMDSGVAQYNFAEYLATETGAEIWFPEYPIIPEHNGKEALEMAMDLYRNMLAECPGEAIALGGDSAGGGLALSAALAINAEGLDKPNNLFLVSPGCNCGGTPRNDEEKAYEDLLLGRDPMWSVWVYRALTFLVISCPCALVISIPLSFFAGIGGASHEGVLIKGSNYLETLSEVKTLVFDKTGTLTRGVFEVSGVHHSPLENEALLEYAALVECSSSHPISKSLQRAYGKEIDRGRVTDIEEIGGEGVIGKVDGHSVAAGNAKLMRRLGLKYEDCHSVGTIVHMAVDGEYSGHIVISDLEKPNVREAMLALRKAGVRYLVMLTGDAEKVAAQVAEDLVIDEYHAELLPADKVRIVEELMEKQANKRERLAFVGDGINDAPVLARADIGIAMGALGSDAAIEAADIVLMDDDPMKIAKGIRISRKCVRIVYENIVFALGVKFACLILGALGIANMWAAIFADVGVMVIAVLNAVRALNVKKL